MPKKFWLLPGETIPRPKAFPGDCDDIRRQIAAFLATKTMSKAEFLRQCGDAIGKEQVNPGSYAKFMALKGPDAGEDYGLYQAAKAFFALRAGTGSASTSNGDCSITAPALAPARAATSLKATKAEAAARFAALCAELKSIDLSIDEHGDERLDAMSCSVVRRRLNEFIGGEGITQSAMISHLGVNSNSWGECAGLLAWSAAPLL
jgi:hypothetical protein